MLAWVKIYPNSFEAVLFLNLKMKNIGEVQTESGTSLLGKEERKQVMSEGSARTFT